MNKLILVIWFLMLRTLMAITISLKTTYQALKSLLSFYNCGSHCVMEATGYYHYQLAYHLLESGIKVSVENPLAVKRFIQMKLSKIKTDKSDSKLICDYANQVDL
jgi:transposase